MTSSDVFISHSSKDKAAAEAICAALERHGVRCWIAPRDILPGSEYGDSIIDGLDGCKLLVLIFSVNANQSPHIIREVERVVSRNAPVVPVRIDDVQPTKSLAYFVGAVHWLDAMVPPLEKHLESVAASVQAHLTLTASRGAPAAGLPAHAPTTVTAPVPETARSWSAAPAAIHSQAPLTPAPARSGWPKRRLSPRHRIVGAVLGALFLAGAATVVLGYLPAPVRRLFVPDKPPPPASYFTDAVCNDKADQSNIRTGAGSGYTIVARLQNRFHVKVLDTVNTSGGYPWLKIGFLDTTGAYREGFVDHILVNERCDKLPPAQ